MRICNNKSGLMDCGGGCYVGGVCISKCKCEDCAEKILGIAKRRTSKAPKERG